jgi:hypothetical protein
MRDVWKEWKCGVVALWHCGAVELWRRGIVAQWRGIVDRVAVDSSKQVSLLPNLYVHI